MDDKQILKNCPFCGDEHFSLVDMTFMHESGRTKGKRVKCNTCGCQAPDTVWNTRAPLPAEQAGDEPVASIKQKETVHGLSAKYIENVSDLLLLPTGTKLYTHPVREVVVDEMTIQALREAAEAAYAQCIGRQTGDDEGSTRWLEAGKCARQARDAIHALIPKFRNSIKSVGTGG